VLKEHFYRHLHRVLELSFVRELAADCYASGGRPSIDPEVFFRLQLVMFFEGIRSERQLVEQARYNLAIRWYAGYNLDEPLPDHSSLSKIRTRLGLPVFRRFFEAITEQCVKAGLVRGDDGMRHTRVQHLAGRYTSPWSPSCSSPWAPGRNGRPGIYWMVHVPIKTMREMFTHELGDIYDAEQQFLKGQAEQT